MINKIRSAVIICFFLISCKEGKFRSVVINKDTKAYGDIDKDTVYNGLIIFSDLHSGRIIRECNYLNGVVHGEDQQYYDNGQLAVKSKYNLGKKNGDLYLYDSSGKIVESNYFFYDLRVGNNTDYKNGAAFYYKFYSLDNNVLLSLNYDSLKYRRITELQPEYFFYHFSEYFDFSAGRNGKGGKELFIYTPNPPRFDFEYSLVTVDSAYNIQKVYKKFDNDKPWSIFEIDDSTRGAGRLNLQLIISDSINGGTIKMYKKL